jgi:hypothetical protein
MRLLYPCDPFNEKRPDENYLEEYEAARAVGLECFLFSAENFAQGDFKPRPKFEHMEDVLYRGWMLTANDYARLHAAIARLGSQLLTSPEQYTRCHYLPEWYALCEPFTPKTIFLNETSNFTSELAAYPWQKYFVKDYVKSLTTARGSVASSVSEIPEIVALIKKFRGQIEGGICIREFEHLLPETEERYFVFRGTAFARDGVIPQLATQISGLIDSPFYSIDLVQSVTGTSRLIELGDGQVSDVKRWPVTEFVKMFGQ